MLYVPEWDFYVASTNLVVRTAGDPAPLAAPLAAAVAELDGNVPVYRIRTLAAHVGAALGRERVTATFLSAFGVLALALASIGLYGAVSYTTQIRAREFGIRLAVGARPAGLVRLVLAQGTGLTLVGLGAGLAVAAAASRVLTSLLYGVSANDGLTYLATAAVLMAVALAASAVPARRAMRLDPTALLRDE
jgi:ABC-type antimicrobial peptide transport system permease subunit